MDARQLIDLIRLVEVCRNDKSESAVLRNLAKSVPIAAMSYARIVIQEIGPVLNKHGLTKEETDAITHGRKIEAIKFVRGRTGMSLSDAKNHVEAAMVEMSVNGCKASESQKTQSRSNGFTGGELRLN